MDKQCCKCKNTKKVIHFSKNKSTKDGFAKQCKDCINNNREYKNKALKRTKEYYIQNKQKVKEYKKRLADKVQRCIIDYKLKIIESFFISNYEEDRERLRPS